MAEGSQPTDTERTMAGCLNLASIPFPYLGPIVGFVAGHRSPYVRFHALRSLLEQALLSFLTGLLIAISLIWSVVSLFQTGLDWQQIDWKTLLIKTVAFWLLLGLFWLVNLINALRDAAECFAGRMPRRLGWAGRIARRMSGLPLPAGDSTRISGPSA